MPDKIVTWGELKKHAENLHIPDEAQVRFRPGYMEHLYGGSGYAGIVTRVWVNKIEEALELQLTDVDWG